MIRGATVPPICTLLCNGPSLIHWERAGVVVPGEGGDKWSVTGRPRTLEVLPPHRGPAQGTHSPRQVAGYLSFRPEVTGLQDICRGGVLAGEWVGEEEGWLG